MAADRLLTVAEAAARLNVTERWVRRAIFERRFDVVHLGRLVRVPSDTLDAYIESNRDTAHGGAASTPRPQARRSRGARTTPDATANANGGHRYALTSSR